MFSSRTMNYKHGSPISEVHQFNQHLTNRVALFNRLAVGEARGVTTMQI